MSRRKGSYKREVIPDPVFKDVVIAKFVNKMMYNGKKSTAQALLYGALEEIKGKAPEEPMAIFKKAIENVKDAEVEITFDPPWSKDLMSEEAKLELGML